MRRLRIIIPAAIVLAGLLSGVTVVLASRSLQAELPLERLALQPSEMSASAKQLSAGNLAADDERNMLGSESKLRTGQYTECYFTSALASVDATDADGHRLGVEAPMPVIQTLYRYATDAEAQAQFRTLCQAWSEIPDVAILSDQDRAGENGRQWIAVRLFGSEGDAIYWYTGVKGRILTLLCADDLQALDGRPRPSGEALFEALLGRALAR